MEKRYRVALVGDYNAAVAAHQAIPEALRLAGHELGVGVEWQWLHTALLQHPAEQLASFDGIWCVPASPYENPQGALDSIRYAREMQVPFLGSCGGFQHAIVEYARNVIGIEGADHAETQPSGDALVISPLACSLVEKSEKISLAERGRLREAYGSGMITESYHCSYGINPEYAMQLFSQALRPTAWGAGGEIRAAEFDGHPFFVGTLFQSERRALKGEAPPLVVAFVDAMA
jgi:CTP synthase (UTP-ammonia lyase)